MLHKMDKGPIYGVRGVIHFFKEKPRFLPKETRTHEKTYVFSHAHFASVVCIFDSNAGTDSEVTMPNVSAVKLNFSHLEYCFGINASILMTICVFLR